VRSVSKTLAREHECWRESALLRQLVGRLLSRRWLQDISKIKLADFSIFFAPPPPLPVPRVYPRLTRQLIKKTSAPDKKIGLIKTFSRAYPAKGEHAPGK